MGLNGSRLALWSKTGERSRSVKYLVLTCFLFHQPDIHGLRSLQLVYGKTNLNNKMQMEQFKTIFILEKRCIRIQLMTKEVEKLQKNKTKNKLDLHHPHWHEETDPRAWWSCSSSLLQAPFCNPALGSRHRSDNHLLIYHCCVVSFLFAVQKKKSVDVK